MAEVATARAKRARSPSPSYVDTLASPLEVLLKRRRRTTWTTNAGAGPPVWDEDREFPGPSSHHEMSSPLARGGQERDVGFDDSGPPEVGVERRRARQWERLQAPQLSLSQSQAQAQTMSQPPPPMPDSSPLRYSRAARAISHPPAAELPTTQHLSSSPVRHQPPSSTPFRADDGWSVQERLQEWGEEYASQNSLLHSLHLAREQAQQSEPHSHASPHSMRSVDMTGTPYISRTPAQPPSSGQFLHPNRTPSLPTPYRYAQRTPLDTPGLASSPGASSDAQYSPFPMPSAPHASPHAFLVYEQEHVRASYEETNRLLAQLNMQRLRRHSEQGDTDEHVGWMDESP